VDQHRVPVPAKAGPPIETPCELDRAIAQLEASLWFANGPRLDECAAAVGQAIIDGNEHGIGGYSVRFTGDAVHFDSIDYRDIRPIDDQCIELGKLPAGTEVTLEALAKLMNEADHQAREFCGMPSLRHLASRDRILATPKDPLPPALVDHDAQAVTPENPVHQSIFMRPGAGERGLWRRVVRHARRPLHLPASHPRRARQRAGRPGPRRSGMTVERLTRDQVAGTSEADVTRFIESDFRIRQGLCPNGHGLMAESAHEQECDTCGFSTNKRREQRTISMSFTITIPALAWWQWALVACASGYGVGFVTMLAYTRRLKMAALWPIVLLALCFGVVQ
jgi:hypothetical protein